MLLANEVGDTAGENPRLARPGTRHDEQGPPTMVDRLILGRVQIRHPAIVRRRADGAARRCRSFGVERLEQVRHDLGVDIDVADDIAPNGAPAVEWDDDESGDA